MVPYVPLGWMAAFVFSVAAIAGYIYHKWQDQSEASGNTSTAFALQRQLTTLMKGSRASISEDSRAALPDEECVVCRCEPPQFPKDPPSTTCAHPSQVCHSCLQKTIQMAVASGTFTGDGHDIRCPSSTCEQFMGYSDVQKWADPAVFQRYDREIAARALRSDPNFVRCVNTQCNAGQVHTGGNENPIVTCYVCQTKQCRTHQIAWHTGFTCKEWDKQTRKNLKREELSADFIKTSTKACPAPNCGRRIQKSDGCDHMTCRLPAGCGHQFCWICLAPWEPIRRYDNSKHYDHCKYYSGQPRAHPSPFKTRKKGWLWWGQRHD